MIFAHADVDRERFTQGMLAIRKLGVGVTSYSSDKDRALLFSQLLRMEGARLGSNVTEIGSIESIDVSGLSSTFAVNHDVFVQNPFVFGDIARLMSTGERPPNKRTPMLRKVETDNGIHWAFESRPPASGTN